MLELAAAKADWGKPLPRGRGRGIAAHFAFGSYVAQVAEVSVTNGKVSVHRVVCAVDCGRVMHPDGVAQQVESAIAYGLSAALKNEITIAEGRVMQGNFGDYNPLRIDEMPHVEVHLVAQRRSADRHGRTRPAAGRRGRRQRRLCPDRQARPQAPDPPRPGLMGSGAARALMWGLLGAFVPHW